MDRAQEVLQQIVEYFQKVFQVLIDLFSSFKKDDDTTEAE